MSTNMFYVKPTTNGSYMVGIDCDVLYNHCSEGSYNIVGARVLGLSYPQYLRFLRDEFGAKLKGKVGYSYAIWENEEDCKKAVNEINSHWKKIKDTVIKNLEEN